MPYLLINQAAGHIAQTIARYVTADGFDSISFIVHHCLEHQSASLRYVVPTGRRVRWLLREITRQLARHGERPLLGFSLLNLAQLGATLHQQLYPDDTALPLTESLQLALFEQVIAELSGAHELPFYAPNGKPSWSIIERLASVISGLREDGIGPDELRSDLETTSDPYAIDRARLGDILRIYQDYCTRLENRYRDNTAIFERVSQALTLNPQMNDHRTILIEGFTEFRVPELRMLGALASTTIPTCIVLTYSRVNGPLFGNLEATYSTLTSLGYQALTIDESDTDHQQRTSRRSSYLRRWLFNTEKEIRNPAFNDCITILGCTNRVEEVTLIAKYIKHCLVRLGYKPHQICVAMRDPELYAGLFRELFAVHGIPANISDRFRLDRSPVTVAVISALELLLRGWRRHDIHRVLSNPLVRCMRADGTPVDAATIINVAERYRISGGHGSGGRQGLFRRLRDALSTARAYAESLAEHPYSDPLDRRQAEQDVEQLERAIKDLECLAALLPDPPRTLTPEAFCSYVRQTILDGLGITASVEQAFERSWQLAKQTPDDITYAELLEQETRAYAALLELLVEIEHAWSTLGGRQQRTLDEYVELFTTMVRATRYQIAEKPSYGVTVTSIEQTRGIPYDVYILCGMVDGEFPRAYSTEYFLGKELPESEQRHIRAERIQFYEALTNNPAALESGRWRMLLTYPRLSTNGEPLVRSSFIDKLLKVTTLAERCLLSHTLWVEWTQTGTLPTDLEWIATITAPEESQRLSATASHDWELSDNVTLDDHAKSAIASIVNHPFSAEELERYAQCPYQYFAQHILALRKPPTYELALSSLESGTLLHRILQRFYHILLEHEGTVEAATGLRSVQLNPERRNEYATLLLNVAAEELDRLRHSHPLFALECEQLLGTATKPGILTDWLDRELARIADGWEYKPAFLEFAFGMRSARHQEEDDPIPLTPNLTIRGRIDRIEVAHRDNRVHAIVADYKLRYAGATNTSIRKGIAFQMPFYMLATKHLFQQRYGVEPVLDGGIYYIIRPKDDDAIPIAMPITANQFASSRAGRSSQVVKSHQEQAELLNAAIRHAEKIVEQIRGGIFPVSPRDENVCTTCAFASVCRIRQLHDDGIITGETDNTSASEAAAT